MKSPDESHDQLEQNDRRQRRYRDSPEPVPPVGAVDLGRFVVGLRNPLQRREKNERPRAGTPQSHQDQGRLGEPGIEQPGRIGKMQPAQKNVDQAEVRIQHPGPEQGARHAGNNGRKIKDRAVVTDALDLEVQQQRNEQRAKQRYRNGYERHEQRVTDRFIEAAVFHDRGVIVHTHPFWRIEQIVFRQAEIEGAEERIHGKNQKPDDPWGSEDQPQPKIMPLPPRPALSPPRRR